MANGLAIRQYLALGILGVALLISGCIDDLEEHEVATGKIDGVRPKSTPVADDDGKFLDFNFDAYKRQAMRSYRQGRYQQSAAYLLEIVKRDINNEVAIFDLSVCYAQLDDPELAADYLERAVKAGYEGLAGLAEHEAFMKVMDNPEFAERYAKLMEIYEEELAAKGKMLYVETPRLLQCRVLEPEDYDSEQSYDLVLGLHGYGDNHNEFIQVWDAGEGVKRDFIYAVPQGPYPFVGESGDVVYSWSVWDFSDRSVFMRSYQLGEEYVLNAVERLREDYQIDNVYLMGFSQGCTLAFLVGIRNAETFDGVIGFGGMLSAEWVGEEDMLAGKEIPIFIGHGDRDRTVRPSQIAETKELFDKYGYEVSFYEFHGRHELPDDALERAAQWVKLISANNGEEPLPESAGSG